MNAIMYLSKLHIHKVNPALQYKGGKEKKACQNPTKSARRGEADTRNWGTWVMLTIPDAPERFRNPFQSQNKDTTAKPREQRGVGDCQMTPVTSG